MKKVLILLFISSVLAGCSTKDDLIAEPEAIKKELSLSVKPGQIYTNNIDFEFEILDGNGGYTVSVSNDKDARATIEGNKVKVNLLRSTASVTVTDKDDQSASVVINSSAKSLIPSGYGIFIDNGTSYTMKDISFGEGGYTIEKIKGTSAEVVVVENDELKVIALKPGNSYYNIVDKRGTKAKFEVYVTTTYDLSSKNLEIAAINDQIISVIIKQGVGDWKIVGEQSYPIFKKLTMISKGDKDKKYDILNIATSENEAKGSIKIPLQDKAGNTAYVTVNLR